MKRVFLTNFQKQLWLEWKINPNSKAYNINFCYRLKGNLNIKRLKNAVLDAYKKCGLFGLRLKEEEHRAYFETSDEQELIWEFIISDQTGDKSEEFFEEIFQQYSRPFKFDNEPLYRNLLVKNSETDYFFCLTIHHIILDAISARLLIANIEKKYNGINNEDPQLSFIKSTIDEILPDDLAYWHDRLTNLTPYIKLLERNEKCLNFKGRRSYFELDESTSQQLISFSRAQKSTLFLTVATIAKILLYRYTQQDDLCVGYSINVRKPEEAHALGFYINTLPLRTSLTSELTTIELLHIVKENRLNDKKYQKTPTSQIINYLRQFDNGATGHLFNVFVNQSLSFTSKLELHDVKCEHVHLTHTDPQYDLLISFDLINDTLCFEFEYNLEKYDSSFIESLQKSLKILCQECIQNPQLSISKLNLLSDVEEQEIVKLSSGNSKVIPYSLWTPSIIQEVAKNYSENTALIFNNDSLSYKEFDQKINSLASCLKHYHSKDDYIGVCLSRSLNLVLAIHGIQKAGKAYVPLDPEYPQDRLIYMLKHSKIGLLITTKKHQKLFDSLNCSLLFIEDFDWQHKTTQNFSGAPEDTSYVIYTSGSTGVPKGIAIPHKGLVNRIDWMQSQYPITSLDKVLHKTPYSFDVSVWELFWPLMMGASLVIAPPEIHKDPLQLSQYIDQHNITVMHFVPSMLQAFLSLHELGTNQSLRYVFCSGEAISFAQIKNFKEHFPNAKLHNLYGPTEASIDVTFWDCSKSTESLTPPIGYPIQNMQCLVLDFNKKVQPIGVPGELHLSGIGLAKEYINSPELTAKSFISNPYSKWGEVLDTERMYSTGDLTRYLPDGTIEYLGRIDNQVKIRGFRIELEEIQNVLASHPSIQNALVLAKNQKLICYYKVNCSSNGSQKIEDEVLRVYLRESLPEFMLPNYFVEIDTFPLTPSGKIDRKKLPEPHIQIQKNKFESQTSKNDASSFLTKADPNLFKTETILKDIWHEVLGLQENSFKATDSFFKLGGDSISLLQVIAKARKKGIEIKPHEFLSNPTFESITKNLKIDLNQETPDQIIIQDENLEEDFGLLPIQQWFFENYEQSKEHFHQYCILKLLPNINEALLKEAINHLTNEHKSFNLRFKKVSEVWRQYYDLKSSENCIFEIIKSKKNYQQLKADLIKKAFKSTNIQNGKLFIVYLIDTGVEKLLFLAAHHLVIDFVSWKVLFDRLEEIYESLLNKNIIDTPQQQFTIKTWFKNLIKYGNNFEFREEIDYWRNQIHYMNSSQLLSFKNQNKQCIELTLGNIKYSSQDIQDIILASLTFAFKQQEQNKEVIIEREGHGREHIKGQPLLVADTVGWFTTKYPTKYHTNSKSLNQHLEYIKGEKKHIPHNGLGYGILKYLSAPSIAQHFNFSSRISFNFLGQQIDFPRTNSSLVERMVEPINLAKGSQANSPYELDLNARIENGKLLVELEYANLIYDIPAHVIIGNFKGNLKALIDQSQFLPVTPFQEGLVAYCHDPESSKSYVLQWQLSLEGRINFELFKKASELLIQRYEILRTIFVWDNEQLTPKQKILEYSPALIKWSMNDLRELTLEEKNTFIKSFLKNDKKKSFNISQENLIRFHIFILEDNKFLLVITTHHLIMDGQSSYLIRKTLLENYDQLYNKEQKNFASQTFYPYIKWINIQSKQEARSYWASLLKESMPTFLARNTNNNNTYRTLKQTYTLSSKSIEILQQENLTLAGFFNAVLALIIANDSHQFKVSLGNVISLRPSDLEDAESIIGPCINTIPIIVDTSNNLIDILEFTKNIHLQMISSYEHAFLGITEIMKQANNSRLFDVLFSFQNYRKETIELSSHLNLKEVSSNISSHFPLSIVFDYENQHIVSYVRYKVNSFTENYILSILNRIFNLFEKLELIKNKPIKDLSVLLPEEKTFLASINSTSHDYQTQKTISDLFDEQAIKTPEKIALFTDLGDRVSYHELKQASDNIAQCLLAKKITGCAVGVYLPRNPQLVAVVIGILKSGNYVVSLEIDFPQEKIEQICKQVSISVIITNASLAKEKTFLKEKKLMLVDTFSSKELKIKLPTIDPYNTCLANYTSGSTGTPKLVLTNHKSHVNRLTWLRKTFPLDDNDLCVLKTKLCFAPAFREIFEPLIQGKSLLILPENTANDLELLLNLINKYKVTRIFLTPSFLNAIKQVNKLESLAIIKHLEISGESLETSLLSSLQAKLPSTRIYNRYGCTEVASMIYADLTDAGCQTAVNKLCYVGRPAHNTCVYAVNTWLQPCGIDVPGEILIGSDSQALGYSDPALTTESFIDNPIKDLTLESPIKNYYSSKIIFRTGDLGKILPNGMVEYIGRKNRMIKVRGFRVEPEEVEFYLQQYKDIEKAIVLAQDVNSSSSNLVAFVKTSSNITVKNNELQIFLKEHLPAYMIPSIIVFIESIPLTPSGKINYQELIKLASVKHTKENESLTKKQRILKEIFSHILNVNIEEISLYDNFFEIGGNSLLAFSLIQQIKKNFKTTIKIHQLYECPTILLLDSFLEDRKNQEKKTLHHMKINFKTENKKIFMLPPAGGSPHTYKRLEGFLSSNISIIAFEAPYLDPSLEKDCNSINFIASYYLEKIREFQEKGPYSILGWSFGGTVAFELASQLKKSGDAVQNLFLVDPGFNLESYTGRFYDSKLSESSVLSIFKKQIKNSMISDAEVEAIYRRMYKDALLIKTYQPNFYESDVILIKPKEINQNERNYQLKYNGLDFFVKKEIYLHSLPGNHITMLTDYPQEFAELINSYLEVK